jgi:hypothetical protein
MPLDQTSFFHAIDERCNVRAVDKHHPTEFDLCQSPTLAALMFQERQDIELHVGEFMTPKEISGLFSDLSSGVVDSEKRFMCRIVESFAQSQFGFK